MITDVEDASFKFNFLELPNTALLTVHYNKTYWGIQTDIASKAGASYLSGILHGGGQSIL